MFIPFFYCIFVKENKKHMELKSNTDRTIKCFLTKNSIKKNQSKSTDSYYYILDNNIGVRFSTHFSKTDRYDIDIIKASDDLYHIILLETQINVQHDRIIDTLKSLLICLPHFTKSFEAIKKQRRNAYSNVSKLQAKYDSLFNETQTIKEKFNEIKKILK